METRPIFIYVFKDGKWENSALLTTVPISSKTDCRSRISYASVVQKLTLVTSHLIMLST